MNEADARKRLEKMATNESNGWPRLDQEMAMAILSRMNHYECALRVRTWHPPDSGGGVCDCLVGIKDIGATKSHKKEEPKQIDGRKKDASFFERHFNPH